MKDIMCRHAVVFALVFGLAPAYAQQFKTLNPPLKNWAAPLYWAPTPAEDRQLRIEHGASSVGATAQAAGIFTSPGPMTFIAITPCRVLDTRGEPYSNLTGSFGPPNLTSGVSRQVPMPSSSNCTIPINAGAYSLNITVIPDGGGTMESLSAWPVGTSFPGVSTINDPVPGGVLANAAIVVAGTGGAIQVLAIATSNTDLIIDINGYYTDPTDASQNTSIGTGALSSNTGSDNTASGFDALQNNTASQNTATGAFALQQNTSGTNNTATGYEALEDNIGGSNNTAFGRLALASNTSGSGNVAVGGSALQSSVNDAGNTALGYVALANLNGGSSNTAVGNAALSSNTSGFSNTAVGFNALRSTTGTSNTAVGAGALANTTTGGNNIAIGDSAGAAHSGDDSYNIDIGSPGVSGDGSIPGFGVIRIGAPNRQAGGFYAAGIFADVGISGATVMVSSSGQLGINTSSRRFKKDIEDMGDASDGLLKLRPVTFRYKEPYHDGSNPLDYGLIAEEVADVYPDLVVKDKDGQIETIQYQKLTPMLLNEVQKQAEQNRQQAEQIHLLEDRLAALEAMVAAAPEPAR